jgi:tyramine---L-glutamate ligase
MRIVVLEHFTTAPRIAGTAGLEAEGQAMRDAVVADFIALPDVTVTVLHRHDRPVVDRSPRLRCLAVRGSREATFREVVRTADAALVIAPETEAHLALLSRIVEEEGRLLLGPSSTAVDLAADKLETARRLATAGVPTPETEAIPFESAARRLAGRAAPFVVKPRDGCGCRGVSLVRRRDQVGPAVAAARRSTRLDDLLVQEYVAGQAASVSIIAAAPGPEGVPPVSCGGILALGLNRQRVRGPAALTYLGGEVPMRHRLERAAVEAAGRAVTALAAAAGGVRGYLGVDLVLGRDGPRVIEINPRLTTPYIALRRVTLENLAGLIREAAIGRPLPGRVRVRGSCRFGAGGDVECRARGKAAWRSTSAGTSAARI